MRHLFRGLLVAAAVVLPQVVQAQPAGNLEQARALATSGRHREALALLDVLLRAQTGGQQTKPIAEMELLRATSLRAEASGAAAASAGERAQIIGDALKDPSIQVRARLLRARLAEDAGDSARFASLHDEAMRIAEAAGDRRLQISVLTGLAQHARRSGRAAEALAYQAREIQAADAAGDAGLAIRGRTGRSTTLLGLGRYDEALVDSERAAELAKNGTPSQKASTAFSLAQVHAHIWNLETAADLWDEAIARYRESGLQIGVALALRQSMDTLLALGDFERAAKAGGEALALFERTGSGGTLADTLARLALIEARRGDPAAAAVYAARARASASAVVPRRRIVIENDLGLVSLLARDGAAAARAFREVRAMAREHGDIEYEWRAEYGLGRAALLAGDPSAAHHHLQRAADMVERMRRTLPDPAQRASFMIQRAMVHEALVEALVARSSAAGDWYARRAFEVAETARARALADQLAEARARSADPAMQALQKNDSEFSRRLADLQKAAASAPPAARDERMRALEQAELEYESMLSRVRREHRRYASLAWPQPATADDTFRLLAPDQALVAYLAGKDAGWGWAARGGRIAVFKIPAEQEIARLVRAARESAAADGPALRDAAGALYRALLAPARDVIGDAPRLFVIPDGPLHRLPFALLRDGDRWLVERHAVSVVPSATVLAALRQRDSRAWRTMLAFAAPAGENGETLPNAAAEAREAARLMGGWSSSRIGALEADVKSGRVDRYRMLHFAAHTRVDERVPRRSAIVMTGGGGEDGLLQLNEIAHLDIDADLVVLAACRSHMGRALRGEGFLSLSRSFMQAGARAVMAAVWDVDDENSRRLMQGFYRHASDGAAPDQALRQAQLDLIGTAPPAAWAGMVVSGDAARPIGGLRWSPAAAAAGLLGVIVLGIGARRLSAARRRERRMPASTG